MPNEPRDVDLEAPDIEAIAERAERATPGPWTICVHDYSMADIHSETIENGDMSPIISVSPCAKCLDRAKKAGNPEWVWKRCTTPSMEDFVFIAHARQDIPALLKLLAARDAEIADYEHRLGLARLMVASRDAEIARMRTALMTSREYVAAAQKNAPRDFEATESTLALMQIDAALEQKP